jgi:hypothetical protein
MRWKKKNFIEASRLRRAGTAVQPLRTPRLYVRRTAFSTQIGRW